MCEKAILVKSKDLQDIFDLVRRSDWEAINWNQYATVPVSDPENIGFVKIRNTCGVQKYILEAQRLKDAVRSYCDVNLYCDRGMIPCHRVILQYFSPLLKDLISDQMKQFGTPSSENPIPIMMMEYQVSHMKQALVLFYTGFTSFPLSNVAKINEILAALKVNQTPTSTVPYNPTPQEKKKRRPLAHYELIEGDDDDDEEAPSPSKNSNSTAEGRDIFARVNPPHKHPSKSASKERNVSEATTVEIKVPDQEKPPQEKSHQDIPPRKKHPQEKPPQEKPPQEKPFQDKSPKRQEKPAEFRKVPPGAFANRVPCPRIQRSKPTKRRKNSDGSSRNSEPVASTSGASSNSPVASTSKAVPETETGRARNAYTADDDYQPNCSGSESEQESNKESSNIELDDDEIPLAARSLRSGGSLNSTEEGNARNTTLAERVKTRHRSKEENIDNSDNKRYPQRNRKEVPRYCIEDNSEEQLEEDLAQDSDSDSALIEIIKEELTPDQLAALTYKCFFCKEIFPTEEEEVSHSSAECAKHLNDQFTLEPEKKCLICGSYFPSFSHYGVLRHVNRCYMEHGRVSSSKVKKKYYSGHAEESEDEDQERSAICNSLCGDEKIPIGDPRVKLEKLSMNRIRNIIDSVRDGGNVDIPRLPGLNYVRVVTKKELPDFFPDDCYDQNDERIRILEQEQEEARAASERRQQWKKLQQQAKNRTVVPPLILNRSRLLEAGGVELNAEQIYQRFVNCSCGRIHDTIHDAVKCLRARGRRRCWVCCIELSMDSPMEQHYRIDHHDVRNPGLVTCPICRISVKYVGLPRHMKSKHFKSRNDSMLHQTEQEYFEEDHHHNFHYPDNMDIQSFVTVEDSAVVDENLEMDIENMPRERSVIKGATLLNGSPNKGTSRQKENKKGPRGRPKQSRHNNLKRKRTALPTTVLNKRQKPNTSAALSSNIIFPDPIDSSFDEARRTEAVNIAAKINQKLKRNDIHNKSLPSKTAVPSDNSVPLDLDPSVHSNTSLTQPSVTAPITVETDTIHPATLDVTTAPTTAAVQTIQTTPTTATVQIIETSPSTATVQTTETAPSTATVEISTTTARVETVASGSTQPQANVVIVPQEGPQVNSVLEVPRVPSILDPRETIPMSSGGRNWNSPTINIRLSSTPPTSTSSILVQTGKGNTNNSSPAVAQNSDHFIEAVAVTHGCGNQSVSGNAGPTINLPPVLIVPSVNSTQYNTSLPTFTDTTIRLRLPVPPTNVFQPNTVFLISNEAIRPQAPIAGTTAANMTPVNANNMPRGSSVFQPSNATNSRFSAPYHASHAPLRNTVYQQVRNPIRPHSVVNQNPPTYPMNSSGTVQTSSQLTAPVTQRNGYVHSGLNPGTGQCTTVTNLAYGPNTSQQNPGGTPVLSSFPITQRDLIREVVPVPAPPQPRPNRGMATINGNVIPLNHNTVLPGLRVSEPIQQLLSGRQHSQHTTVHQPAVSTTGPNTSQTLRIAASPNGQYFSTVPMGNYQVSTSLSNGPPMYNGTNRAILGQSQTPPNPSLREIPNNQDNVGQPIPVHFGTPMTNDLRQNVWVCGKCQSRFKNDDTYDNHIC